jgi:hypothetical protein
MSLLLDALKNASARKDETAKESNQTTKESQDRESSQKLAASFFRISENNSLLSLRSPFLIAVLTIVLVISGAYWWQLHFASSVFEENKKQPIQVATQETSTPAAPAIPDVVTAAIELESMTSLVDQMQSEHASVMANEERKRKELEITLLEKAKTLKIAEQEMASLKQRLEHSNVSRDQLDKELSAQLSSLQLEQKQKNKKIETTNRKQQELTKSLDGRTQALALAEKNVAQLNAQSKKDQLAIQQFEEKLVTEETSNKQLQQIYDAEKALRQKETAEIALKVDDNNKAHTLAILEVSKLQQEKAALANQLNSLQKENKTIRDEQTLASTNIAKIQKIQDSIFLQLKDKYKSALEKIKRYESDIEQTKSLAAKENSPNPKEGIPLKLDMQLGAIGNQ